MARHIVVIGLMGSGKTTVGRLIASSLGWPYRDNDSGLRRLTGHSAAWVQEQRGADELHRLEGDVLDADLAKDRSSVIAAAASSVLDPALRARLTELALVVWLRAEPAILAARARPGGRHRPLPHEDAQALLEAMDRERAPLYRELADLEVDVGELTPARAAAAVLANVNARRRAHAVR
jgi:shikimate kinase